MCGLQLQTLLLYIKKKTHPGTLSKRKRGVYYQGKNTIYFYNYKILCVFFSRKNTNYLIYRKFLMLYLKNIFGIKL